MKRARVSLAVILLLACVPHPPLAAAPPTVRIATWNVKDFFDATDDPKHDDERPSEAEVARKVEQIAAVLREIEADVVLLEEVENLELLKRVAAAAAPLQYGAFLREGADPRGIDVALLSRLRMLRYEDHSRDLDASGKPLWSRDLVEAYMEMEGRQIVLIGSHLKSRRMARAGSEDRRREQAQRMREVADGVLARWPHALVVVGGDLNDEPGSWSLAPLFEDGAWTDLGARLPPDAAWTWNGRGRSRLDYLLVPRDQGGRVRSVSVWSSPAVMKTSDHRPVVAVIEVPR